MPTYVANLTSIMVFMFIGSAFVLGIYGLVRVLAPTGPSAVQVEPYECGELVVGEAWMHINVRYYVFAMLFLIFDIETVFLFAWALIYKNLGLFGLVEMILFILVLLIGLIYPWKKGVLGWEKEV
jgi:NADH-quinone oxidoreductase subunit A